MDANNIQNLSSINTVWLEGEDVRVGNTIRGKVYQAMSGSPWYRESPEKIDAILQNKLREIHKKAQEVGEKAKILSEDFLQRTFKIQNDFEHLRQLFLLCFGRSADNQSRMDHECALLLNEMHYRQHLMAADFEKRLSLGNAKQITDAVSSEEVAFIENVLAQDPVRAKILAHYAIIQRNTDRLKSTIAPYKETLTLPGYDEVYEVYNVTQADYEFLGCAGDAWDVIKDYEKYLAHHWPYLCVSLVAPAVPFYLEGARIFQILSVPPQTIRQTSPLDIISPSGETNRPKWYHLLWREVPLTSHIQFLYHRFQEITNSKDLPLATVNDSWIRLHHAAKKFHDDLWQKFDINELIQRYSPLVTKALNLLVSAKERASEDFPSLLKALAESKLLPSKDLEYYESLVKQLMTVEQDQQLFGMEDTGLELSTKQKIWFFDKDSSYLITRKDQPHLQLDKMIQYYKSSTLSWADNKKQYVRLFEAFDPAGKYDILQELEHLKKLLDSLPRNLGKEYYGSSWPNLIKRNRLMGPSEVRMGTFSSVHNEIDLDLSLGHVSVQGWLLNKMFIDGYKETMPQTLKKYLDYAKQHGIPILYR